MKIKCGLCGEEFVVADDLDDGQHVQCPYCNGVSEYSKPSRIELPNGAEDRRQVSNERITEVEPQGAAEDALPARKKFHVIRNETASTSGQKAAMENQLASHRLRMAEEHVRFYEEMKDKDRRRMMREKAQGVLMLIAVVLCAVGAYWYVGYRKEKRNAAEIAYAAERNRLEAERAENERKEKELRRIAEQAEAEKRLAEEKRQREERQKENERLRAEREKAENDLLASKMLYRKTCVLFAEGRFDFLNALPTNALPGHAEGEFYYLLPFLENGEIVVCKSSTNGFESVYRLDGQGKKTPFEVEVFEETLRGKDYLMATEDRVYFNSKRKKPHIAQISKTDVADLVKEFFGDIEQEVKRLDVDPEGLTFEIVFIPKDSRKIIIADTVEYGVQYSLERVRMAIEDAFPMRRVRVSSLKKNKFKRTVVFWDGAHIKRGVDGVTYVPRVEPMSTYARHGSTTLQGPGWFYDREWRNENRRIYRAEHTFEHWKSLCEEARKQEAAEQTFYDEQKNSATSHGQAKVSRAEQAYKERIDKIYNEGALYFRAKIVRQDDGSVEKAHR